jgi:uncharacterized membrane protein YtjA (UPF0391 family)
MSLAPGFFPDLVLQPVRGCGHRHQGGFVLLHYAIVFFIIALIAALFGFGGIAASAAGIAKILFFIFIVLAVASFVFGLVRRG